jgi:hypothetical protein
MSTISTQSPRRGPVRKYRHLLSWIGWTCLVLGVSAMSLTGPHAAHVDSVSTAWPIGPADPETANRFGRIDPAPLMSSNTPAEPNPGPAAIGNYDL